jgi:hypothetical protein
MEDRPQRTCAGEPAHGFSDVCLEVHVSKRETKRKRSGSATTSKHPRDIADLAALVLSNVTTDDPGDANGTLMIFVWRDCAMTIKFPSGRRMYASPRHGQNLDSTHRFAVEAIGTYCQSAGIAVAEIRVHKVPPEARTRDQIFAWFQSIPGISITVLPPEGIGFGGPIHPAW